MALNKIPVALIIFSIIFNYAKVQKKLHIYTISIKIAQNKGFVFLSDSLFF